MRLEWKQSYEKRGFLGYEDFVQHCRHVSFSSNKFIDRVKFFQYKNHSVK